VKLFDQNKHWPMFVLIKKFHRPVTAAAPELNQEQKTAVLRLRKVCGNSTHTAKTHVKRTFPSVRP